MADCYPYVFPFNDVPNEDFLLESTTFTNIIHQSDTLNSTTDCLPIHGFGKSLTDSKYWDSHNNIDCTNYPQQLTECAYLTDADFNASQSIHEGFSIIHFNARSLNANFDSITTYLDSLNVKFHVIAISETWLSVTSKDNFNLHNYQMFTTTRLTTKGGGVSIYVRNDLNAIEIPNYCKSYNDEVEISTIEIARTNAKNINISCIYRLQVQT